MTTKEYLKRHKGKCLKANSYEQADANYLLTWRIPQRESKRQGMPIDRKQRVWGYETLKEAEAAAKQIKGWGGSHVRIIAVGKAANRDKYEARKAKARDEAIEWQLSLKGGESYQEMADAQGRFAKLAKRYGLTEEFRENGII